jgi:hypothetical protein
VEASAHHVHDARLDEPSGEDEEPGDGDDDVVAEARERLPRRESPRQDEADDEQDCDDVDGNLLRREEHEGDDEKHEDCGDGRRHKIKK